MNNPSVEQLCDRNKAMKSERSTWDNWCQELGEVACPRKANITDKDSTPSGDKESQLYNTTAVQCNMTLAHGQMSYAMPFSERWFTTEPPLDMQTDKAYRWYGKAGEIMAAGLATSNFYAQAHEACLDRGGFGTGCLYVEEAISSKSGIRFATPSVGTYSIAENSEGLVDTTFVEKSMTAQQMAQEFGEEKLSVKSAEAFGDPSKRYSQKFTVVHAVYPREDRDTMKLDSMNMEVASCWFLPDEKHKMRESGYQSNPYLVSRYLKWGEEVYGWCPGWQALPAARQLNMLEKLMDGMAEVALYPRMLIPSTLAGNVALGAGGVTIYNPFQNAKPEEWAYNGKFDAGLERLQRREQEIKDAYHYDLFQMFSQLDKQMTAREVAERSSEKLVLFSPTFVRLQEEWLQPLLLRIFAIYLKQGRFPEPPEEVLAQDNFGVHIRPPRVLFTSRIALAIRSLQSQGFMSMLEALQPMLQIDPSLRHSIKPQKAAAGLGRNFGVPEEWLASEEEYEGAVQAEMQQQQEQMAAEQANQMAQTASKLKPEQIEAAAGALGG